MKSTPRPANRRSAESAIPEEIENHAPGSEVGAAGVTQEDIVLGGLDDHVAEPTWIELQQRLAAAQAQEQGASTEARAESTVDEDPYEANLREAYQHMPSLPEASELEIDPPASHPAPTLTTETRAPAAMQPQETREFVCQLSLREKDEDHARRRS